MALISTERVLDKWEEITAWSQAKSERQALSFARRQPFVHVYVLAVVEDEGPEPTGLALEIAFLVDAVYQDVLGHASARVTEHIMEAAATDAERAFEQLVGVEPELALRRFLFARDIAEAELITALIQVMFEESEAEPEVTAGIGAMFVAIKAVAMAYERANGLAPEGAEKQSLGEVIEARLGHPLPKIGRNDPCPCGSGRKFKKCCGGLEPPAAEDAAPHPGERPVLGDSHGEQVFGACMDLVEGAFLFTKILAHEEDGEWLEDQNVAFEADFRPGEPDGVPDSLHVGYLLLDMRLPTSGKTVVDLFREREGHKLVEPGPTLLKQLSDSYVTFFELLERCPGEGRKRVRELLTGAEWMVSDVDDPPAELGDPGEIWCCRFVGPRDDAVTFMSPLIFPPDARPGIEELLRALAKEELEDGLPVTEAVPAALKRSVPLLAGYLLACNGALDIDDDTSDEDWDAEAEDVLEKFATDYYEQWPDMPLPALNGKTPRAAVRTKVGRKKVRALLDDFEHMNTLRAPDAPPVDVAWLRRELGLD